MNKNKKKKILYIITKSNWGGAQKSVYDLATRMPGEQFDVSVALGGNGTLATKLAAANIRTINLPFLERDISFLRDGLAFFSLILFLWRERPDIVHLHSSKIGAMGAVAARMSCIPRIIFTAHGWAFREKRLLPVRLFIVFFQWLTVIMSHATIAVSNITKHEAPLFFPRGKIVVIPNGIAEPHFLSRDEARAHLAEKTGAPLNTFWIGTIGELTGNKGYIYAIRAIADLALRAGQQLTYIIIGTGEDKEKLLESIRELTVIATRVGGIPDIIQDKKNGVLVPPRDSDALAEAIGAMAANKTMSGQYAEELFATAQRNFSLPKMIQETIALYTPTIS